jgi:hypothetical protein
MDIRLHPRGQAFVIFPNVEMATQALNDVHGYILHNKPMVIVSSLFGNLIVYIYILLIKEHLSFLAIQ